MKKPVDLLQIIDAENRLTQLGSPFPVLGATEAAARVNVARVESTRGMRGNSAVLTCARIEDTQCACDLTYLFMII